MPFYIRARARYPLWLPPTVGGGLILVIALVRFSADTPAAPGAGLVSAALQVLLVTAIGAIVAGGFYWGFIHPAVQRSVPLRWLLSSIAILLYLMCFTLAFSHTGGQLAWSRLGQLDFLGSSLLLAVLLGWVIGRDLFGLTPATDRVYFSPADFAKLSASEQATYRIDGNADSKEQK